MDYDKISSDWNQKKNFVKKTRKLSTNKDFLSIWFIFYFNTCLKYFEDAGIS